MKRSVRIGIDVGGTFTHAVAIDHVTYRLIGQVKLPTTHKASEGVALGIVQSLSTLLAQEEIAPEDVVFIAHSTTQATNALLEGDVAPVGILGMGAGLEGKRACSETRVGNLELAPGKFLPTYHRFLDTSQGLNDSAIESALDELVGEGARTIVAAGAFSVDDPSQEIHVMEVAERKGLPATGTHEISQLYGLKIRTRTAVVNASILPKMIQTACMTEESVRKAGITAPLMIMRSDGGVMSVDEIHKRPILTILSGPAAGVAAALMYVKISDGIFLEVGGTSTDISVIRDGKALVKTAEVGGHKLFLRTLDVRTIGLAGGSMPRVSGKAIHDVGPRSAHIAGLPYVVFSKESQIKGCLVEKIQPTPQDPDDYIAIRTTDQNLYAVTPTCASNYLGLVPVGNSAEGSQESAGYAFEALGTYLGKTAKDVAQQLLHVASEKLIPTIKTLIEEYCLDKNLVELVGGGGGAAAVVPFSAQNMQMNFRLAENAAVISAIGVALAMVRDVIERSVVNPTEQDIIKIRHDAQEAVVQLGASPETVEVLIEIDSQRNILRATASGATEMRARDLESSEITEAERLSIAAKSLKVSEANIKLYGSTDTLFAYGASLVKKKLFGLMKIQEQSIRVVDKDGIIRLQKANAFLETSNAGEAKSKLSQLIERHTAYGDGGIRIPDVYLLVGSRLVNFSGLASKEQLIALSGVELELVSADESVVLIASMG